MKSFSRRDFLRLSAAGLGALVVTADIRKIASATEIGAGAKDVPGQTIATNQTGKRTIIPQHGCLVGCYREYALKDTFDIRAVRDASLMAKTIDELSKALVPVLEPGYARVVKNLEDCVGYYQRNMGCRPAAFFMHDTPRMYIDFPAREANVLVSHNIRPGYYAHLYVANKGSLTMQLRDIVAGKHDAMIQRHARSAAEWGEANGECFVTTMHEPNVPRSFGVRQWIDQKEFSGELFNDAWRHIHDVCGKEGMNKTATWFIEYYAMEHFHGLNPGPDYVDVVGLSVQNWVSNRSRYPYAQFKDIIDKPLKFIRENYKGKPIGITEVSTTNNDRDQPQWVLNMLQTVKENPDIKLLVYMDNKWGSEDHTLGPPALKAFGAAITKDPYFIVAK